MAWCDTDRMNRNVVCDITKGSQNGKELVHGMTKHRQDGRRCRQMHGAAQT